MKSGNGKSGKASPARKCGGQVVAEFVIMLTMCAIVAITLLVFFYYFSEYGWKMLNLVGIDYP